MKPARFTLFQKSLLAVIMALLPVVVAFALSYKRSVEHVTRHVLDDLELIVEAYGAQVTRFLDDAKTRAEDFSSDGLIRRELASLLGGGSPDALSTHLRNNKLPLNDHIRSIHVTDPEGRVVASTDGSIMGADLFEMGLIAGERGLVEVSRDKAEGPMVAASAPVADPGTGRTLGHLVILNSISGLNEALTGDFIAVRGKALPREVSHQTIEAYLVNAERLMLTESLFVEEAVLSQKVDTLPVGMCLEKGMSTASFYPDYRGVEVAGASVCFEGLGWALMVEYDAAEAMLPIYEIRRDALVSALVVTALAALFFLTFLRRITRQIGTIAKGAADVARGDYGVSIPVQTHDEIGALAESFNSMASEIDARSREVEESRSRLRSILNNTPTVVYVKDTAGRYLFINSEYERLFGLADAEIRGRTDADIFPADIARVFMENDRRVLERGVAMEFEERAPVGDKVHTYLSIKFPLFDADGSPYSVCGISTDITERKEMEVRLRKNEDTLKKAQEIARMGSWDWDVVENTLGWSDEIYRIFGLEPQQFKATYEAFLERVHPEDREYVKRSVYETFYNNEPYSIDHRITTPEGSVRVVHEEADIIRNPAGMPIRMIGTVQDITERRAIEEKIESLARLSSENPNPVMRISREGRLMYANSASRPVLEILGIREGALMPDEWREAVGEVFGSGTAREMEVNGGGEFYSLIITPVSGALYVNIYGRNITERKVAEFELKKLTAAIEHSVNVIFITDRDGVIEYVNPTFEHVTGYTKEEAIGQTPRILSSGQTPNVLYDELWKTLLAGKTWRNTFKNKTKTGGHYWANATVSPIRDEAGRITHFLAVQEDITEKMLSNGRLERLAAYDETTGLLNRTRFIELLGEWISMADPAAATGVFYLMDVDQFKFINDTFGHVTGDGVLKRLSKFLADTASMLYREHMGKAAGEPIIGRLSSDEFAVFLPSVDKSGAIEIAEHLREKISVFSLPEIRGTLTISTGVVFYPEHGTVIGDLFTKADAAMYRAKELGRNRIHLYRPEDRDLEKMHSRVEWKERIIKALEEERFEPWFQPILDLRTGEIDHYEVLARMRDEHGKVLLPGSFIEVAERFGLIGRIDRMIITRTLRKQAEMRKRGRNIYFSMNLSGLDLGDDELLTFLKAAISETSADPARLVFEITETSAVKDMEKARSFIDELKKTGCSFSLDDFGVGFTSFVYLKELNVDYIKIDGSFIRNLDENPDDQLFVKAMTEVASGMRIRTIAEFVENETTLELLRRFGVDFAQGYHIGKPAPGLLDQEMMKKHGSG